MTIFSTSTTRADTRPTPIHDVRPDQSTYTERKAGSYVSTYAHLPATSRQQGSYVSNRRPAVRMNGRYVTLPAGAAGWHEAETGYTFCS